MKGSYFVFALMVAFLAVSFVCLQAIAAEGDAGGAEKDTEKPKAESSEKGSSDDKAGEEKEKPTLEGRLQALQVALVGYAQKRQDVMPREIGLLAEMLKEKEEGLINPESGKAIKMNKTLAGAHTISIKKPKEFITFYADKDTAGKGRAVALGDGKVVYLEKVKFDKMLKASVAKRLSGEERRARMEAGQEAARSERMAARMAAEKKRKQNK